jgi:predicted MPP superfamily phosphohydrolase
MLTHDPAHWETLIAGNYNVDLTFSGHTHGMQWGIKVAGITFSPAMFARKNWGGIYKNNKSVLHVNTGLGNVFFPWRIDMPGEITAINLKRSQVN